jgi:predicted tellurium resistance membrane protein TerC
VIAWNWTLNEWLSLVTLTALEIALGVDNVLFLSILVATLPAERQRVARILGLVFAMGTRIGLLWALSVVVAERSPLIAIADYPLSLRAFVLVGGGLLLIAKSVSEMRRGLERGSRAANRKPAARQTWPIVLQIGLSDIVFSFDSVFTAVGLSNRLDVMICAIVIAILLMLWLSARVNQFLVSRPTLKMLVLVFLLLVGVGLLADGLGFPLPKAFLYFTMAFAVLVERFHARASFARRRPGS